MRLLLGALLLLSTTGARGEPRTLKMAAIAPEGTAWAREIKALARDVESATHGQLKMKWYLGGIAGDELEAVQRIRKGQLDGEAGAIFCQALASSFRVMRIPGLFRNLDEAYYVLARLRPDIDQEFRKSGFAALGTSGFGFDTIFSRRPVKTMADLKRGRFWVWDLDPVVKAVLPAVGIQILAGPVEDAFKTYDRARLDGMFAAPMAALAYQWSTETRYFTPMPESFLPGCIVVSNATYDSLPYAQQQALAAAGAKFVYRFQDVNRDVEGQLLGGLFEKQGVHRVEPSPELVREFAAATARARDRLGEALVPKALLEKVNRWLTDYRNARAGAER